MRNTDNLSWRWKSFAVLPSLFVFLSLASLASVAYSIDRDLWKHLFEYLLADAFLNTLYLVIGVGILSLFLGVGLAVVTSFYDFPMKKFLAPALVFPLAFPAYVVAFIWIGFFEYAGPFQSFFRTQLGVDISWLKIQSTGGIILVLSLSLYPYVYLITREAFRSLGVSIFEASQSLGISIQKTIFRVALPLAKPWILSGLALVMMESVADFGVASSFNYDTLTILIYRTWFSFFSIETAAQLSLIQLLLVFLIFFWFRRKKSGRSFEEKSGGLRNIPQIRGGYVISIPLILFLGVAFLFPLFQLLIWAQQADLDLRLIDWIFNSSATGVLTSLIVLFFALALSFVGRISTRSERWHWIARTSVLGYAIPGTVLAVALVIAFTKFFGPLGNTASLAYASMIIALSIRFFAVGFQPVENSFQRISKNIDEGAQSLGSSKFRLLSRLHLPIIRRSLIAASILVFMDAVKEMPINVMMRPFGWDTLSVRVYEFTAEAMWQQASLPALVLVLLSIGPTYWVARRA